MMEATRILIDPCEEKKYSGQTQAHIYSQILGLGLELEIWERRNFCTWR